MAFTSAQNIIDLIGDAHRDDMGIQVRTNYQRHYCSSDVERMLVDDLGITMVRSGNSAVFFPWSSIQSIEIGPR